MARQVKSKVKSRLIIFFDIKVIVHKNSSWQAKQPIPHITVTFYRDCVKMCEDYAANFGDRRTGYYITTTYLLTLHFPRGNFLLKPT
jgi:hypothetical protein